MPMAETLAFLTRASAFVLRGSKIGIRKSDNAANAVEPSCRVGYISADLDAKKVFATVRNLNLRCRGSQARSKMRVVVEDYNPQWPLSFAQVKASLQEALLSVPILAIEHVGSTSVPNLAAKPILDIDIIVLQPVVPLAITALQSSGYTYRGTLGIPDRHALGMPGQEPAINLYVCVEGCLALRNHIAVRNLLRNDESLREEYAAVKRELARREWDNIAAYGEAKNQILGKILGRAGIGKAELAAIEEVNTRVT